MRETSEADYSKNQIWDMLESFDMNSLNEDFRAECQKNRIAIPVL